MDSVNKQQTLHRVLRIFKGVLYSATFSCAAMGGEYDLVEAPSNERINQLFNAIEHNDLPAVQAILERTTWGTYGWFPQPSDPYYEGDNQLHRMVFGLLPEPFHLYYDHERNNPLHKIVCCYSPNKLTLMRYLCTYPDYSGASHRPPIQNCHGATWLHLAVLHGVPFWQSMNIGQLSALPAGTAQDLHGNTPLHLALKKEVVDQELLKWLIACYPHSCSMLDLEDRSPLHLVITNEIFLRLFFQAAFGQ